MRKGFEINIIPCERNKKVYIEAESWKDSPSDVCGTESYRNTIERVKAYGVENCCLRNNNIQLRQREFI